jgi:hypothetical protein
MNREQQEAKVLACPWPAIENLIQMSCRSYLLRIMLFFFAECALLMPVFGMKFAPNL